MLLSTIFVLFVLLVFWILNGSSSRSSSNSTRTTYSPNSNSSPFLSNTKSSSTTTINRTTSNLTQKAAVNSFTKTKVNKTKSNSHISNPPKQKFIKEIRCPQFTPFSGVNFSITNFNGDYKWYALYKYYPVNRFNASDLSSKDLETRRHVFDFKDGRNTEYYAKLFASALINQFGKVFLKGRVILVVPASNKKKTEVRFKEFCRLLSIYTGLINVTDSICCNKLNANLIGSRFGFGYKSGIIFAIPNEPDY